LLVVTCGLENSHVADCLIELTLRALTFLIARREFSSRLVVAYSTVQLWKNRGAVLEKYIWVSLHSPQINMPSPAVGAKGGRIEAPKAPSGVGYGRSMFSQPITVTGECAELPEGSGAPGRKRILKATEHSFLNLSS